MDIARAPHSLWWQEGMRVWLYGTLARQGCGQLEPGPSATSLRWVGSGSWHGQQVLGQGAGQDIRTPLCLWSTGSHGINAKDSPDLCKDTWVNRRLCRCSYLQLFWVIFNNASKGKIWNSIILIYMGREAPSTSIPINGKEQFFHGQQCQQKKGPT